MTGCQLPVFAQILHDLTALLVKWTEYGQEAI